MVFMDFVGNLSLTYKTILRHHPLQLHHHGYAQMRVQHTCGKTMSDPKEKHFFAPAFQWHLQSASMKF